MLRSRIGMSVSAALLVGMVGIAGCAGNQNAAGNYGVRSVQDGRVNDGVRGVNDGRLNVNSAREGHTIDRLDMNQQLADRVAALKEVRTANVLTAGRSAYAAVTLENNVTGGVRADRGGVPGTNMTPGSMGYGTGNGTGYGTGVGTPYQARGTGITGTPADNGYGINGGALSPGTGMTGIAPDNGRNLTGTGTMTGAPGRGGMFGNGGVTTGTGAANAEDMLSKEVKTKIADMIKKDAPGIDRVYVSANPDFVQRVNSYADQARSGQPLQGFVNEFRVMAERMFPARIGDNMNR
ncbi:hypothetical protein J2Z22_003936 [Paenibacillus forsythiae]|uniref:YhcN/YlaJ family sporulation lipoprotein n=1 Tax=Paenibacillus forsythiae TaxID=365616 RepID=A0ABU3HC04_9BACL|nr:YhcN/YlaJ family sporulation lipoprotein [Paenibacillus forsythiae]MDT3428344.1 hypothetical protein [Paenibacillus forsythiae]